MHRQLQESEIWHMNQPFDVRSAWIDLLLLANHEDKEIIFDYKPEIVRRGQILTSVRQLCQRWNWGKDRTLKYLRLLCQLQMITKDSTNKRTLITIVKYGDFQGQQDTDKDTTEDTEQTRVRPQSRHNHAANNNVKNVKNERIYIPSFSEFWKIYPRKQDKGQAYKCYLARINDGYSEDQLLTACRNYAAECEKNRTEQKYIKHGATFLSINEPFLDYLKGEYDGLADRTGADEEQRLAEIDEHIRRDAAGEFDHEDEELRRIWES